MDVFGRFAEQAKSAFGEEKSPNQTTTPSSRQSNTERTESVIKAVQEKIPKSVSFKMDEIELIDRLKKKVRNGATKSSSKDTQIVDNDLTIDFVLVYEERTDLDEDDMKKEAECRKRREYFQSWLVKKGLLLEHINSDLNEKYNKVFVLVHAPWDVLERCAEEMMIRVPIGKPGTSLPLSGLNRVSQVIHDNMGFFYPRAWRKKPEEGHVNAFFNIDKQHLFLNIEDKEHFFSDIDRTRIVKRILDCAHFSNELQDFGINRLLYEEAYLAGYPLHGGTSELPTPPSSDTSQYTLRQGLRYSWASFSQWYKFQPLNAIKEYFGVRVSLYFAWLGVYNYMLAVAALVGIICFFAGLGTMDGFVPAQEICDKNNERLFYMCPLCDVDCSYWSLIISCRYARMTYLFDNEGTVFFAAFMALWAAVFLEVWKRKQISLAYQWDMMQFEEIFEPLRPSFVAAVKEKRPNPITGVMEPYIPYRTQLIRRTCSVVLVALMVLLVIAAVAGVIIYRAAVSAALYAYPNEAVRRGARIITSITASCINLLAITILSYLYDKIALFLTNWENPRTRTEFTDSLTRKMFLFQSVNMYSSLFYIAFFKTTMIIGKPGNYNRIGEGRMEGCDPSGCLIELCIQLAIILVGKQLISLLGKFVVPCLTRWWNRKQQQDLLESGDLDRWERDYLLNTEPEFRMFYEYHDIVIQYGFVTMFVAAFPLAPFFALLNNILELRIDAINFVVNYRRPIAERAQDIGSWLGILQIMSKVAIIINSFVIAFTSEFIPRLVYQYAFSPDGSLKGYVNDSLSYFNISDLEPQSIPKNLFQNLPYNFSQCRYKEYFESKYPYRYDRQFYYVLAARLIFVLVFQYLVFFIVKLLDYYIPDIPYDLDVNIKRESYIAKKCLSRGGASITRDYDQGGSPSSSYISCESVARNRGENMAAENAV